MRARLSQIPPIWPSVKAAPLVLTRCGAELRLTRKLCGAQSDLEPARGRPREREGGAAKGSRSGDPPVRSQSSSKLLLPPETLGSFRACSALAGGWTGSSRARASFHAAPAASTASKLFSRGTKEPHLVTLHALVAMVTWRRPVWETLVSLKGNDVKLDSSFHLLWS